MAEYTNNQQQVVNPGETVTFTESPVPCRRGLIRHRDDTGNFLLVGFVPRQRGCCCNRQREAQYLVDFGANIAMRNSRRNFACDNYGRRNFAVKHNDRYTCRSRTIF